LPQYFGPLRWTYYRNRTESHNTILIDNENQDPNAKALLRMDGPAAVIDLAAAYPGKLLKHERRVELSATGTVRLDDTLAASQPVEARWGMMTDASLDISGRRAVLKKAGRTLVAEIQSPAGASFDSVSTQPPPPQRQNEGTHKLVVRLPGKVRAVSIAVTLTPQGAGT
jgi:oligo-alginate lyase